jgi:hypothetical protein
VAVSGSAPPEFAEHLRYWEKNKNLRMSTEDLKWSNYYKVGQGHILI